MLKINEIFKSIQGESSFVGKPCIFIRFTGCNLRCSYCDTKYAYNSGKLMDIDSIIKNVKLLKCKIVEITGGEPLLQQEIYPLTKALLKNGFKVLLETNGTRDLSGLDKRIIKIIDIKCPDSGESDKMYWQNFRNLLPTDEIKFVISSKKDYDWAKKINTKLSLSKRVKVFFSPASDKLKLENLAEWLLKDKLDVTLGLQLHKLLHLR